MYMNIKIIKYIFQIKYEGVYFYGGKNEKDEVDSSLRILKVDSMPMVWIKPEVTGKGPGKRYKTFKQDSN